MKLKIMTLLFLTFLLSGCSATYNVEIYNNTINEEVSITDSTATSSQDLETKIYDIFEKQTGGLDALYRDFKPVSNYGLDDYALVSKTTFDFDDYKQEMIRLGGCCRAIDFSDDGKYINFKTLGYFKWFEKYSDLDELTIRIKTNHKVKEHNADETGRFTYIWHIDKSNYKEKIPSMKLYSNRYVFNYNDEFIKKVLPIIVFVGIIIVGSGVSYLYFKNRGRKVDSI